MKTKITLLLAIITLFSACQKQETTPKVILSGQIENPNSDSVLVWNSKNKTVYTISLDKNNSFADTIDLKTGYYRLLYDGNKFASVFLQPGFNLNILVDAKKFGETIKYTGKGSAENNYETQKSILRDKLWSKEYYGYYSKLSEDKFLKLTDSLYTLKYSLFDEYKKDFGDEFNFIESNDLKYKKLSFLGSFEFMKRYFTKNKDFKVTEGFPKVYENIDLSDDNLLKTSSYVYFIQDYMNAQTNNNYKKDLGDDFLLIYLNTMDSLVTNDKIKEQLAFNITEGRLKDATKLEDVYNKTKSMISDKEYLAVLDEKYKAVKKIEKGTIPTDFELKDIDGNTVKLSDFVGKPVYIDIWATWCKPCLMEIPGLKELEKEFGEEIVFISICKSDTEERWRTMVENKQLGGVQLFADSQIDFFSDFMVQGIPRFIMIDKEGKIHSASAPRPSFPNTKEELKSLI